ncbi:MAG: aminotransferase class I/II-fold pyridoxal phosphate-dependent enzyme, partial [Erysipelotrichales bacterium]
MKERFLSSIYRGQVANALGEAAGRLGDPELINLSLGDPDFITPQEIIDEAFIHASAGHTRYTKPAGDPELVQSIRSFIIEEYQREIAADEVMVTVGACHAMYVAMSAILDTGDEVIVPDPYFVPYYEQITMAGGKFVALPTRAEDDFNLDLTLLETLITPRTKAILINSPNNPTGAVYDRVTLEKLGELALKYKLIILSDEVYEAISFGKKHVSVLEIPALRDRSIVFGSFSKSYAMTGWRIGYAIAPDYVIRTMVQINESICFSAPSISQRAA